MTRPLSSAGEGPEDAEEKHENAQQGMDEVKELEQKAASAVNCQLAPSETEPGALGIVSQVSEPAPSLPSPQSSPAAQSVVSPPPSSPHPTMTQYALGLSQFPEAPFSEVKSVLVPSAYSQPSRALSINTEFKGQALDVKESSTPLRSPVSPAEPVHEFVVSNPVEQLNLSPPIQIEPEVVVVDGTPFGLSPGQFIGPDGTVYDEAGNCIGFLQGYSELHGAQHPHSSQELIQSFSANHPNHRQSMELTAEQVAMAHSLMMSASLYTPTPDAMYDPTTHYVAGVIMPAVAEAPPPPLPTMQQLLEEGQFEQNKVFVAGEVVATISENGNVLAMDGSLIGMIDEPTRKAIDAKREEQKIAAQKQIIADLLHVPNYHPYVNEEQDETIALEAQVQTEEQWQDVKVEEEMNVMEEPEIGIEPITFKKDFFEKKKDSLGFEECIPTRFSRPTLQSNYPEDSKITDIPAFNHIVTKRLNFSSIRVVWLNNLHTVMSRVQLTKLGRTLSEMSKLEVVGIFSSKLTRLELSLPSLLRLDIRYNNFESAKDLYKAVLKCPQLQILEASSNPCCSFAGLPPVKEENLWKLIFEHLHMEFFNGNFITNAARNAAFQRYHSGNLAKLVPKILWHNALNQSPVISKLEQWDASAITKLDLQGQGLSYVALGSLIHLQELNLSQNKLSTIEGCGLHRCEKLSYLDLSNNDLRLKDIPILGFMVGLQQLFLAGNKRLGSHFRHQVIFHTRFLKGSNRSTGLLELDSQAITIEERVRAVAIDSPKFENFERWSLNLISAYGHAQLRSEQDVVGQMKCMMFSDRNLAWVDLTQFKCLQILDLSSNRLTAIQGLEHCTSLRVLNLSKNASLKLDSIIQQIVNKDHPLTKLENVSFASQPAKVTSKYLRSILCALGPVNPKLAVIDGKTINVSDRVHMFKLTASPTSEELEEYQTNLGLTLSATPFAGRSYNIEALRPGPNCQYHAAEVKELMKMSNLDITGSCLHLKDFIALRSLNLAYNKLTDLIGIGLESLHELVRLDVRNNKITNPLEQLAILFNGLRKLEIIALRGNPCMRNKSDRSKLIALIPRTQEVDCSLRVIDTPITIEERVAALEKGQGEGEKLRFRVALYLRGPNPQDMAPSEVPSLNLDNLNLKVLQLNDFSNIQILRLRNNAIETLASLGWKHLTKLRVLDLRDNLLDDLKEAIALANYLKHLEFIGLQDNRFSHGQNSYKSFRKTFIGGVRQLRRIGCPLTYLDEERITADEIVTAWEASDGKPEQCSMFRFDLAVHQNLPAGSRPQQMQEFDLSNFKLTSVDLVPFLNVKKLNLSNNLLEWKKLRKGNIAKLTELEDLSLAYNNLVEADVEQLSVLIDKLKKLKSFQVVGNKCCVDNSNRCRVQFLSFVRGVDEQGLRLTELNGCPITVSERVEAAEIRSHRDKSFGGDGAMTEEELAQIRLILTLESVNAQPTQTAMVLSGMRLQTLSALHQFVNLMVLDVSNNELSTLKGQGLASLPKLHTLDLRKNRFPSLKLVIVELTQCHMLRHLYLEDATTDGNTSASAVKDHSFVKIVCDRLKGLTKLDSHEIPAQLTPLQAEAHAFLWQVAQVGLNTLRNIDISNMDIPGGLFFYVLAAIKELRCVETLRANGNGWNAGDKIVTNYRPYIVYSLAQGHTGANLLELDGDRVSDGERLNSILTVRKEQEDLKVSRLKEWSECKEKAFQRLVSASKGDHKPPYKKKKKQLFDVDFIDLDGYANAKVSSVPGASAAGSSGSDKTVGQAIGAGIGTAAGGVAAGFHRAKSALFKNGAVLENLSGNVINKVEIIINYLQIYSLILILDPNVPWPKVFLNFSIWAWVFSLNIEFAFNFDVPYIQQMKFGIIMGLPLLFAALFVLLGNIDKDKWIDRYITNWQRTKTQHTLLYALLIVLSVIIGFAWDTTSFTNLFSNGKSPTAQTNGIILVLFCIVTGFYLIWCLLVNIFRKRRLKDHSPNMSIFLEWWLQRISDCRKIALFMLTIMFMPVARVILSQVQCICDGSDSNSLLSVNNAPKLQSVEDRSPQLIFNPRLMSANTTATAFTCHIANFPNQRCLPDDFSLLQALAIVFGILYIVGIPAFFIWLIKRGVHQMVDINGYQDHALQTDQRIKELKLEMKNDPSRKKEIKKEIKELKEDLEALYRLKATGHKLPQTYLYAPYERSHRYFKIFNMFQKLTIIVITMFFNNWALASFKLVMANSMMGLGAVVNILSRPFHDSIEDILEILSQITNSLNLFSAVGLKSNFLSNDVGNFILLAANGTTLIVYALTILATPIMYCRSMINGKTLAAQAKEQALHAAQHFSENDIRNAQSAAKLAALQGGSKLDIVVEEAAKDLNMMEPGAIQLKEIMIDGAKSIDAAEPFSPLGAPNVDPLAIGAMAGGAAVAGTMAAVSFEKEHKQQTAVINPESFAASSAMVEPKASLSSPAPLQVYVPNAVHDVPDAQSYNPGVRVVVSSAPFVLEANRPTTPSISPIPSPNGVQVASVFNFQHVPDQQTLLPPVSPRSPQAAQEWDQDARTVGRHARASSMMNTREAIAAIGNARPRSNSMGGELPAAGVWHPPQPAGPPPARSCPKCTFDNGANASKCAVCDWSL